MISLTLSAIFRHQTVCAKPQRCGRTHPTENRDVHSQGVNPAESCRPSHSGACKTPGQPLSVPVLADRGNVPPGFRGESPQEDFEGGWIGAYPFP